LSFVAPLLWVALVGGTLLTGAQREKLDAAIGRQLAAQWSEAASGYRRLLQERPDFVPARLYLAETLWLSGSQEEARRELTASRPLVPGLLLVEVLSATFDSAAPPLPPLQLERDRFISTGGPALALLAGGSVERGFGDYRRAAQLDPDDASLHRQVAQGLLKARHAAEAAAAFEEVARIEPKDGGAWRQLGSSYLMLQRWDSAIGAFEKALGLEGRQPAALLALGYAFERKPDQERALALYQEASSLAPSWAQPHYRIGRTLIRSNRLDEAEAALARALEREPKMAEAVVFLAAIHLQRGNLGQATGELERGVALNPRYDKVYYYLGQAYRRAGREAEARQALAQYEKLRRISPEAEPQ